MGLKFKLKQYYTYSWEIPNANEKLYTSSITNTFTYFFDKNLKTFVNNVNISLCYLRLPKARTVQEVLKMQLLQRQCWRNDGVDNRNAKSVSFNAEPKSDLTSATNTRVVLKRQIEFLVNIWKSCDW